MRTALSLCLTLVLAAPALAQTKRHYPGVSNFTRVDATVACGGAAEVATLDALKKDGFKSVINLRMASEPGANIEQNQAKAKELGLVYVHIPFSAGSPDPKVIDSSWQPSPSRPTSRCSSTAPRRSASARCGWPSACSRTTTRSTRPPKRRMPSASATPASRSSRSNTSRNTRNSRVPGSVPGLMS